MAERHALWDYDDTVGSSGTPPSTPKSTFHG